MTTELVTLESAQEAKQIAESKLAVLRAQVEATAMERTLALIEAPQPVQVPWSEYPAFDQFNSFPSAYDRPFYWTSPEDRTEGRYRPLYENEYDLRRLRADARRMHALFPVAQAAIGALADYTISTGWEFQVKPKKKYKHDPLARQLAAMVQEKLDTFLDRNDFVGGMDRQIHDDARIDGECFPTLYEDCGDKGKHVRIDLVDPDYVVRPLDPRPIERMANQSHKLNFWWHGVHTQFSRVLKRDDVTRPVGYHVVFDKTGDQWDYLPANRVEHIKRNVGPTSRRGVTEFLSVFRDLEIEAKLRRNTAEGAAILAAIVMIRQHAEGTPKNSIEGMVTGNATARYERPLADGGTRTTSRESTPPGTVKDIPYGMTATTGPLGTLRSPVYIEVDQHLLRIIAARFRVTEWMISSDASSTTYASSLTAEHPVVKAREHDQACYATPFISLMWKAMAFYSRLGAFSVPWEVICERLDIDAEYSSPASRDPKEMADVNKILSDMGIKSDRSIAADHNLDLDEEIENGAKKAPPEPSPFGGGGFGGPPQFESTRLHELAAKALASLTEGE